MRRTSKKVLRDIALGRLARALVVATDEIDGGLEACILLADAQFADIDGLTEAWNQLQAAGSALLLVDAALSGEGREAYAGARRAAADPIPIPVLAAARTAQRVRPA